MVCGQQVSAWEQKIKLSQRFSLKYEGRKVLDKRGYFPWHQHQSLLYESEIHDQFGYGKTTFLPFNSKRQIRRECMLSKPCRPLQQIKVWRRPANRKRRGLSTCKAAQPATPHRRNEIKTTVRNRLEPTDAEKGPPVRITTRSKGYEQTGTLPSPQGRPENRHSCTEGKSATPTTIFQKRTDVFSFALRHVSDTSNEVQVRPVGWTGFTACWWPYAGTGQCGALKFFESNGLYQSIITAISKACKQPK